MPAFNLTALITPTPCSSGNRKWSQPLTDATRLLTHLLPGELRTVLHLPDANGVRTKLTVHDVAAVGGYLEAAVEKLLATGRLSEKEKKVVTAVKALVGAAIVASAHILGESSREHANSNYVKQAS